MSTNADNFEAAVGTLDTKAIAREMYANANACSDFEFLAWDKLDADEREIREYFAEDCVKVIIKQYKEANP